MHLVERFANCFKSVFRHENDFSGAQFTDIFISEIQIGKTLNTDALAVLSPTDRYRCSAIAVS
jgi:hypothetical protein